MEQRPKVVYNHIGRAYGILANAHSITSKETMNFLSLFRLGVDMGVFPGVDRSLVDELFLIDAAGAFAAQTVGQNDGGGTGHRSGRTCSGTV